MKNTLIYLALAFIVFVSGCDNGKNNDPEPSIGFRLSQYSWSQNGVVDDTLFFTYNDDNQVVGWSGNYISDEVFKVEVSYPNNNTVEFLMYDSYDSILQVDEKIVYTFNDGYISNVVGYYSDNSQLVGDYKTNYQYNSDGNLNETIYYEFEYGSEEMSGKYTFTYDGNLLQENIYYHYDGINWLGNYKTMFQYTDNVLDISLESYYYDGAWIETSKNEFVYEGSVIKQVKSFSNLDANEWELNYFTDYYYDNDGNMTKLERTSKSGEIYAEHYKYEAKPGNLSIFNLDEEYGYPSPIYSPTHELPSRFINTQR